jgi:hypothetical protein
MKQVLKNKPAKCHPERALYANEFCRPCYEKHLRDTNPEYAERQRENCRRWSLTHTEAKRITDKVYRKRVQTPAYNRARNLRKFGITPDDYDQLLQKQGGVCAICHKPPKLGKRLSVDHCHDTGRVRGLLCFRCNFGLSYFAEDAETLKRAARHVLPPQSVTDASKK